MMVPMQINGGEGKARSLRFSNQQSQNIYLTPDPVGSWNWISYDFYGSKAFVTRTIATDPKDRGLHVFNDTLYQVAGTTLYSIDRFGTSTSIGTIPGVGRCIFEDDGSKLYIVTGNRLFEYDVSITEITTNIDSPTSIAYLNGFFAVERGSTPGGFAISDSGAGDTYNGLSIGIANSSPDPLKRIIMLDQLFYLMGEQSIEPWYFNGQGNLNFARLENGLINIGTPATYSVAKDSEVIYFLGSDRGVYIVQGSQHKRISTEEITRELEGYDEVDEAIGFTFTLEGQKFYCLTLPDADKTYLYSRTYDYWVTLSTGTDGARWLGNSYAFVYDKHYVGDYRTGSVNQLDASTYDDLGATRIRTRVTEPLTAKQAQLMGNRKLTVGSIYPEMEVGVGLATGQGSDPKLICSIAPDGQTFTNERFVDIGVSGDTYKKPVYDQFITGDNIVAKFSISDPVKFVMGGAHAEVSDGGY